jgi:disulfide oxidoreductase YuzD
MRADRTSNQNAMIHALYGDIARHDGSISVIEVKRMCKLMYGVPILRAADPEWCEWYDTAIKHNLSFEDKLLLMDHMDITSEFNKEQATQFIDTILKEYGSRGFNLEDPR